MTIKSLSKDHLCGNKTVSTGQFDQTLREDFRANLGLLLTYGVSGVCPEEMVELSGLVELMSADCTEMTLYSYL